MNGLVQIGARHLAGRSTAMGEVPQDKWRGLHPRSAQIYLENRCHLRCRHCFESSASHPPEHHLSLEDYDALFGELAGLGVLFVTLTGGEIFLRKDALDIIALARRHRFAVTLFTTGTLLDDPKVERIRELKVSEVHVSVYSHEAEAHDAFTRSPGSHAKSVRALAMLQSRGVRTVLKANVLRINIDHLDELMALAASLGAEVQIDPSVRVRMDGHRGPLALQVSPEEIMRKVLVRPDLAPSFRRHAPEQLCTGERSVLDDDTVMCGAARDMISIGADGSIYACGFFSVAAGRWQVGDSLGDIWLGSRQLDAIRETTFGKMNSCSTCAVRATCNPCMAFGQVERGSIGACNSTSRHGATALRALAELKARANTKMSTGRQLPVLDAGSVAAASARQRRLLLTTEP